MKRFIVFTIAILALAHPAHAQITKVWDGTNTADVTAANAGASAAKKGLVVTLSPNSGGAAGMPSGPILSMQGVVGGTALPVSVTSVVASTVNQGTGAVASAPWSVQLSDGAVSYTGAKTGQFPTALIGGRLDVNLGASGITLPTDPIDRAARLLGIIYGSQGQQLLQSATNFNLYTELRTGSTAYDARQIRALGSGTDSVTIVPSGTQTVSGTVTANQGGAWSVTATQSTPGNLQAQVTGAAASGAAVSGSPVLVAGSDGTNARSIRTATDGTVRVDPTGTTTQPISATALPLPAGAATAAKQPALGTAGSSSVDVLSVQGIAGGTVLPVSGTVTVTPSGTQDVNLKQVGAATIALGQTTMSASIPVAIASNQTAVAISVASLPLPTGAATETTLSALNGKFGPLGQKTSAGSAPVVIASDQSAVPVSGTVTANIGTTNGLALDASVTALQVAQASTTSGQSGPLAQTATTTAAPTYLTGKTNPLSTTTAGALRTDASATTQPVSGTVTANAGTGNFTVVQTTASSLNANVSGTVTANIGTTNGLALDATLTGGTQQTKITDGTNVATVKAASTAAGATDKAVVVAVSPNNSVAITAASLPLPTGAAADSSVNGLLVAQGSTTSGQSGPLAQTATTTAAPTYITGKTNPLSTTTAGALRTDASATTQPVSGTVTANAGTGNFTVAQATASNLKAQVTGAGSAGTADAGVVTIQGISGGTVVPVSGTVTITPSGTQTVTGTVTANIGTSGSLALDASVTGLQVAQASTTSGQKGSLTQGAVTTSAPSYTTAQTSPLSLTTTGDLRVQPSVIAGTTPTTTAVALTTTGAQVFASTSAVKFRKIANRAANPSVYCVYFNAANVTSEATSSFTIQPGQTWEMPTLGPVVEYTGQINCATSTSTGSVQALQGL